MIHTARFTIQDKKVWFFLKLRALKKFCFGVDKVKAPHSSPPILGGAGVVNEWQKNL